MVKRLRACVAMLACVVPLVGPGVAHAGCTAIAGASAFDPGHGAVASHHGISCTTNNGSRSTSVAYGPILAIPSGC